MGGNLSQLNASGHSRLKLCKVGKQDFFTLWHRGLHGPVENKAAILFLFYYISSANLSIGELVPLSLVLEEGQHTLAHELSKGRTEDLANTQTG